jgi:hypothetical protein
MVGRFNMHYYKYSRSTLFLVKQFIVIIVLKLDIAC